MEGWEGAWRALEQCAALLNENPLRVYSSIQHFYIRYSNESNCHSELSHDCLRLTRLDRIVTPPREMLLLFFLTGRSLIYHLNKHSDSVTNLYQVEV